MKRVITALILAGLTNATAAAQMHGPPPMTKAQYENAVTGSNVNLVVRVTAANRATLTAELLEPVTETSYKTSGTTVKLFYSSDTPIVMGSQSDVKPGAVVFVFAVATGRDTADAKKFVVMTPYVSVK